jgi:hypothetical protein
MILYAIYSCMVMLFIFSFIFFRQLFQVMWSYRSVKSKLAYVRESTMSNRFQMYIEKHSKIHNHLKVLLESVQSKLTINSFLFMTGIFLLCGVLVGGLFFYSLKGVVLLSVIFASLPYLVMRTRQINIRLTTRLEFLPAVEIFYQYYLMNESKNMKNALKTCLQENRLSYNIKPVFDQLYRNLMTLQDDERSLNLYSLTLGHVWAQYFTSIFRIALHEGVDVSENLKDLIHDMRKAQRVDQAERNRLLEIRIANFTPCIFLVMFLFINFKVNQENAYLYYVVDPVGRGLILDALFLIFISFLMGIYLSLRRM